MTSRRIHLVCILCLLTCVACTKQNSETQTASASEPKPVASTDATAVAPPSTPTTPAPKINPARAFQYVKEFVSIGSRPPGSPGHAIAEQYMLSKLKGGNRDRALPADSVHWVVRRFSVAPIEL